VVGTEFDVLRHDGRLRVTVRRGVVSVQSPDETSRAEPIVLRAGDQLDHREGERAWVLQKVDPEAAFAWRRGDLVYRDQALADVVEDLNRYFETPVSVTGPAASLRFSGVLKIDSQEAVVRRLQAFLPITAARKGEELTLRMRQGS
jgi:transmembrane sensor